MKLSTAASSQRAFLEKPSLDKIETASRERLDLEESLEGLRLQDSWLSGLGLARVRKRRQRRCR